MIYINRYGQGQRETVDQIDAKDYPNDKPAMRQALNDLIDNNSRSDTTAYYYESSRACSNWK